MKLSQLLLKITPFSIIILQTLGISIYHYLFPGAENWGLIGAYFFGIVTIVLFVIDLLMKLFIKKMKLIYAVQTFLIIAFLIWLFIQYIF